MFFVETLYLVTDEMLAVTFLSIMNAILYSIFFRSE